MAQATTILDAADKPAFIIFKEQRIEVPIGRISPNMIKAVVSVEDQRFFEHSGVDGVRVAAAVVKNIQARRRAEGGSTITQQLARQSFLSRDKTYRRKLKEVILAAYLEKMYSKNEILEVYLNKVYFGDGLYGVEAASRGYFAKSASDLTIAEAALLAGLIQSPSSYAPTVNLTRAIARRNVVLQAMVASGAIDQPAADRAKSSEVKLVNGLEIRESSGLYFKEQVRRELVDRFGWERVYQGGLRVHTTMDTTLQRSAETLVEKGLSDVEQRRGFRHPVRVKQLPVKDGERPAYLQGALVAMDPATGYVRAMVGGRDFGESSFNRAVQAKRQSGSAFKPFVYAAALEAGYSPGSVITRLNEPIETPQGGWLPEDEHSSASSMTLRTALRTSSNRAAVQLLNTVGIPQAVGYAQKLNVGTPPSVPSLALGASDVTLISLTAAYGAFANGGTVRQPVLIRRVEDSDGTVLYSDQSTAHRAVSESTAFLMSSMLADVVNSGTAYRARQSGFTLPAAGKTGTTNGYVDAWFVGFTPAPRHGRLDRVRSTVDDCRQRLCGGARGSVVGELHESRDERGQARLDRASLERRRDQRLPRVRQAAERGVHQRRRDQPRGRHRNEVDGLHRILHGGNAAGVVVPAARLAVVHGSARRAVRRRSSRNPDRRGPGRPFAGTDRHERGRTSRCRSRGASRGDEI